MKQQTLKNIFKPTLYTVVIWFFQGFFFEQEGIDNIHTHLLLFSLTTTSIAAVFFTQKNKPEKTGFVFIGFGTIKMAASIIYLAPFFSSESEDRYVLVLQFFIIYFLYLFLEVSIIFKQIKRK